MKRLLLVLGVCAVSLSMLAGEGWAAVLESPRDGATLSGLGFISGWKCDAGEITVRLDRDDPIPLAAEQPRADTRPICGTTDNGFITQLNWALLGDGKHTAVVYEDGVEFARATFEVMTTGEEFLTGVTAHCSVPDFPAPGENVLLEWEESTQHFELTRVSSSRVDGQRIFTGEAAIIDADTLTLGEERIRFIGIDAPERHQLCLDADGMCYRCGQIATEVLKERVGDDSMVSCYLEPDRDSYGRALGVCFGLDGTDLNGWLVANGHAVAYTYYSSRYVPQEGIATAAQRGIWDGQFVVPSQWRRGERLEVCQTAQSRGVGERNGSLVDPLNEDGAPVKKSSRGETGGANGKSAGIYPPADGGQHSRSTVAVLFAPLMLRPGLTVVLESTGPETVD